VLPRGADGLTRAFTDLVAQRRFTVGFAAVALLIALALGALHALAPGHGKTIMAAYAAGHGRRARRDVLTLGVTVTATHTVGVLMLGLLVASGTALAAGAVYAWLGIASGALVAAVGVTLLRRAVRTVRAPDREHGHGHAHTHDQHVTAVPRRGGAALMGFAGGLVPSPSAVLVLVGAAAIGRAWFGVVLVLAYGAGLALTLILVGLLVVGSGLALGRRLREFTDGPWPVRRMAILLSGRRRALLPLGSSAAVVMLGLGLVLRSLPAAIG
jgi:ABC-type nickel/cobalt efflux system permease component RcnA